MAETLAISRIQAQTRARKPSFDRFKADSLMPGETKVAPGSQFWHSLKIDEMLKDMPYLLDMIKAGKATLMHYDEKSSSCEHKARISGLGIEDVYRMMIVEDSQHCKFGIVTHGQGKIDLQNLFSTFGEEHGLFSAPESIRPAKEPITGMEWGTCTPCLGKHNIDELAFVVFHDPEIVGVDRIVDISIGGAGETAHRLSLRIRYGDIIEQISLLDDSKVLIRDIPRK
jgi:prolyl-tRNA editing enzyme YbaK/EbsC (Cys-tRNA(Pro) deacylase)